MHVLISGGAGFIGSTTAHLFQNAGHKVTILDDLSTGHRRHIEGFDLVEGRRDNPAILAKAFENSSYDVVLDFAAFIQVEESMRRPKDYYANNTFGSLGLIDAVQKAGVKHLVFSSTGSVYGDQTNSPITEAATPAPLNPYATSKYLVEQLLRSYELTHGLNWAALRYFNVAGAYQHIGQDYPFRTHLLPNIIAAQSENKPVSIFGTDYDTPDGTAVRDYIHVEDIARAHLLAAERMIEGAKICQPVNLGTGTGYTVLQMVDMVQKVSGLPVNRETKPRRPGDAAKVIASNVRAKELFGWTPEHDLESIVKDALAWQNQYHKAV